MGRLQLTSLALLVLGCGLLQAQVDPGECDSCWRFFKYDSSLVIGAHQLNYAGYAARHYPMNLHQIYFKSISDLSDELRNDDPPDTAWINDPLHPWGGYWTIRIDGVPDSSNFGEQHFSVLWDELQRVNLLTQIALGIKVSLNPFRTFSIYGVSEARENYYVMPYPMQQFLLCDDVFDDSLRNHPDTSIVDGDTVIRPQMSLVNWRRTFYDTLTGNFHWTRTAPSGDTVLLASRPDYIWGGFEGGGSSLYTDAGLPDSTRWMSVGVALRTDVDSLQNILIADNDVIAYIDLFVRNRRDQDSCKCWFLEPWQRIPITKKWFLERVAAEKNIAPSMRRRTNVSTTSTQSSTSTSRSTATTSGTILQQRSSGPVRR